MSRAVAFMLGYPCRPVHERSLCVPIDRRTPAKIPILTLACPASTLCRVERDVNARSATTAMGSPRAPTGVADVGAELAQGTPNGGGRGVRGRQVTPSCFNRNDARNVDTGTRWDTARLFAGHRRGCLARLAMEAISSAWKDRHQRIRVTNFRPIGISLPSLRTATHPPAGTRFIADTCERRIIQDRWALTNWSGFSRLSMLVRVPDIRNDLVPTCRRT